LQRYLKKEKKNNKNMLIKKTKNVFWGRGGWGRILILSYTIGVAELRADIL
jgi:hypothetical protein